jgi:hypothetical protein
MRLGHRRVRHTATTSAGRYGAGQLKLTRPRDRSAGCLCAWRRDRPPPVGERACGAFDQRVVLVPGRSRHPLAPSAEATSPSSDGSDRRQPATRNHGRPP